MKPEIQIDTERKIIQTTLKDNMSKNEIYEFVDELHEKLKTAKDYSLFNNASEKSFADLDAMRELSDSFRQLLAQNHIQKFATLRPQNDYYSENTEEFSDKFKIFSNKENATNWLLDN